MKQFIGELRMLWRTREWGFILLMCIALIAVPFMVYSGVHHPIKEVAGMVVSKRASYPGDSKPQFFLRIVVGSKTGEIEVSSEIFNSISGRQLIPIRYRVNMADEEANIIEVVQK